MRLHSIALVLLILAAAAPAAAQLTPEQARAKADKAPVVIFVPGGTWKGRLVDIDLDTVTIELPRRAMKILPLSNVLRIEAKQHDSPADGALVGGLLMTLWCLFVCAQGASTTADVPGVVIRGALFGTVVGGVIDARHSSTVSLYASPAALPPRRPPGLAFTVRF